MALSCSWKARLVGPVVECIQAHYITFHMCQESLLTEVVSLIWFLPWQVDLVISKDKME